MTFYQLCLLFFIYAFLGWCTEVCYAAVVTGKFTNRGFLNGPLCPIYGFGVLIVILCLSPLQENLLVLFAGSVLLTTLLEYITGFILEKCCHAKWWDYSDRPFNLHGYICLEFSLLWGFACLIVVRLIHPTIFHLVELLPHLVGVILLVIAFVLLATDLAATINTVYQMNRQLTRITELAASIHAVSDKIGTELYEGTIAVKARSEDAKDKLEDAKQDLDEKKQAISQRMAEQRQELDEKKQAISQRMAEQRQELDEKKQAIAQQQRQELERLRERLSATLGEKHWGQRRLLKAFPALKHQKHQGALEQLRRFRQENKEEGK